jgi:hypothetical protein
MNRIRITALAASLALTALSSCGSPPTEQENREAAANLESVKALANSADGSAASAVGDMMNDPSIRDQLGMPSDPAAKPPVQPQPGPAQQAAAPSAPMTATAENGDGSMPSQVKALALCRGVKAATRGAPFSAGPEAERQAAADLAADPTALSRCQNG